MALTALTYIMKYLIAKNLKNHVIMVLVFVDGTHVIKFYVYHQIQRIRSIGKSNENIAINKNDGLPVKIKWFSHLPMN